MGSGPHPCPTPFASSAPRPSTRDQAYYGRQVHAGTSSDREEEGGRSSGPPTSRSPERRLDPSPGCPPPRPVHRVSPTGAPHPTWPQRRLPRGRVEVPLRRTRWSSRSGLVSLRPDPSQRLHEFPWGPCFPPLVSFRLKSRLISYKNARSSESYVSHKTVTHSPPKSWESRVWDPKSRRWVCALEDGHR